MYFKITIVEYDDTHNSDASITRINHHEGDPIDILRIAVEHDNQPSRFQTRIHREPEGTEISLRELIEAARGTATTEASCTAWIEAMVSLIDGWVHPRDDAAPIPSPPEAYWHDAGARWARLVHVPPPQDLIDALAADPRRYNGYDQFVCTARTATTSAPSTHTGAAR